MNSIIFKTKYNNKLPPAQIQVAPPNNKELFRNICNNHLPNIRTFLLPNILNNSKYEAVLIEYRIFPHLEFLIRNSILQLGDTWSYTVVCGNLNYSFIVGLCNIISPNIKVIKTNFDNLNQSTYSILLASTYFWNLFYGDKILIYQEDSCIFKSNINDFLKWDYIGAPWLTKQNDTANNVGNGGLSLRTKQCMLDVINKLSIDKILLNSSTLNFMKNAKMTVCPEDVYFSKTMQDYNIGLVADYDSAAMFSTELIYNGDSFGGHNFWLNDINWKNRIDMLYCFSSINSFMDIPAIKHLNDNHKCICVASPYEYTIGGGEKYLSFIIKTFILKGYKIIFCVTNFLNNIHHTLKHYFTINELLQIHLTDYYNIYDTSIEQINFKYFVFMYNNGIPDHRIKVKADKKIFHCQFPFDYEIDDSNNIYSSSSNDEICSHINAYDNIIVNSEYTYECIIDFYKKYNYNKLNINIIYPPCINNVQNSVFKKQPNLFVMVGRFFKYNLVANNKYFDVAISIFNKLNMYNYKLIIIGSIKSTEQYNLLNDMIVDKNKIILKPNISDVEKDKILQMSTYYIQLTGINDKYLFNNEHFGISMIEAINNGCVPISINKGYPLHIIKHNENGYLINNANDLNKLIKYLLTPHNKITNCINIEPYTEGNFINNLSNIL